MGANCVASTSIGLLFCCKGCNAEKLKNAFTFLPPSPSYQIASEGEGLQKKWRIVYALDVLQASQIYMSAAQSAEVIPLKTKRKTDTFLVWIRRKSNKGSSGAPPIVLIHCHGNATDVGMMMRSYYELAQLLGIDVVGVEYSGYGRSTGTPSTKNTLADIEAAYELLVQQGVPPSRIVAYGQSIGSGPASHLAAKFPIGGVILHSPMMSGIRVIDPLPDKCCRPSCVWACFDFYPNLRKMKTMACPAFVLHGQRDEIVPFFHGLRISKACPEQAKWPGYFPARAGHNDLVEADARSYYGELSRFLQEVGRRAETGETQTASNSRTSEVEMVRTSSKEFPLKPDDSSSSVVPITSAGAVAVGPTDGRYGQMRQGNVRMF